MCIHHKSNSSIDTRQELKYCLFDTNVLLPVDVVTVTITIRCEKLCIIEVYHHVLEAITCNHRGTNGNKTRSHCKMAAGK